MSKISSDKLESLLPNENDATRHVVLGYSHANTAGATWHDPSLALRRHMLILQILGAVSLSSLFAMIFFNSNHRLNRPTTDTIVGIISMAGFLSAGLAPAALLSWRGVRNMKAKFIFSSSIIQILLASFVMFGVLAMGNDSIQGHYKIPVDLLGYLALCAVFSIWLMWGGIMMLRWCRRMGK
jgi:hypothetical protein